MFQLVRVQTTDDVNEAAENIRSGELVVNIGIIDYESVHALVRKRRGESGGIRLLRRQGNVHPVFVRPNLTGYERLVLKRFTAVS